MEDWNKIDSKVVEGFHGILKEILDAELEAGNAIIESWCGDWPVGVSVVFLKESFKTAIQKNLENIEFRNINDPHYWKAEYKDKINKQMLICGFDYIGDFREL
jgi:hypothetical protein